MQVESNIVQVAMNGEGVVGRRGLSAGRWAGEPRACRPWGHPRQLHRPDGPAGRRAAEAADGLHPALDGRRPQPARDLRPQARHRARRRRPRPIETAVPGISIAEGWEQTAKVMKDIALVRSMTNKEGNHQRATYQLHTGYVPTGHGQAPAHRLLDGRRAGREQVRPAAHREHRRADDRGGLPRRGARAVRGPEPGAAARQHPAQGRRRPLQAPARPAQPPRDGRLRPGRAAATGCATIAPSTARPPGWSSRPR